MTNKPGQGVTFGSRKGVKQTPPLQCYTCLRRDGMQADARNVRSTGATQMLADSRHKGKRRRHSELICSHGHKWWSCHPAARTLDRRVDLAQQVETGAVE